MKANNQKEIELKWQRFIENRVGFILPPQQYHWLWSTVNRVAQQRQLTPLTLLQQATAKDSIAQVVIDAVLIPQSLFFRHLPSFDYLAAYAKDWYMQRYQSSNKAILESQKDQDYSYQNTLFPTTYHSNDTVSANINDRESVAASTEPHTHTNDETVSTLLYDGKDNNISKSSSISTSSYVNKKSNVNVREDDVDEVVSAASTVVSDSVDTSFEVWSVGCSYGQEVWSAAMLLAKLNLPYKIWGSDVSEKALSKALSGEYSLTTLAQIPKKYHIFAEVKNDFWQVKATLRQHTQFFKYNMFTPEPPPIMKMDAIICQNVLIYFRQFDQRDILNRLVAQLNTGGILLLAPGEAVHWHHPDMERESHNQINAWKKIAPKS